MSIDNYFDSRSNNGTKLTKSALKIINDFISKIDINQPKVFNFGFKVVKVEVKPDGHGVPIILISHVTLKNPYCISVHPLNKGPINNHNLFITNPFLTNWFYLLQANIKADQRKTLATVIEKMKNFKGV